MHFAFLYDRRFIPKRASEGVRCGDKEKVNDWIVDVLEPVNFVNSTPFNKDSEHERAWLL
jgi:hypothetical protein